MAGVSLTNVVKRYGTLEVIHGATLEVEDGELVVFVGPSGCGKSTLLRMIAGLEDISGGEIRIGGTLVNDVEPADRATAMVFQSYALYPHMTVEENLSFGLRMTGNDKADTARRVARAAEILQIAPLLQRRPRQLSGGQRQRVAIGRAIVREPRVFLFDEPLSNLDAELRVQMRVELARLHAELGVTMIYVTHDQVEAMTLADRIVVLRDGRIEQIGRPLELYRDPANQFVAGFVGSPRMNFMAAEVAAADAGGLSLALVNQGGARLALPPVAGVAPGERLVLGLRPEHFAPAGAGDCDLTVGVDVVEHLGATSYVYANTTTEQLIVEHEEAAGFGDRLTVSIPAARAYVFDAAGRRLRPAHKEQDT
jgi:lactose/L-arabinose transport system ATP-binding protein